LPCARPRERTPESAAPHPRGEPPKRATRMTTETTPPA
jgi:hypothetical protein